jgi:FSR family fosmidomycin resistance protein-like MFS transporter
MFYQLTASLLQPVVGMATDRKPLPWLLPLGMILTCSGIYFLATSHSFHSLVFGAMTLGAGSSVFHPEASRIVRATSRGSHGLAQSIFQTGGSLGSSLGPVVAVFLIAQGENTFMKVFSIGVVGVVILFCLSTWHSAHNKSAPKVLNKKLNMQQMAKSKTTVTILVLLALIFSKFFYLASISNYFAFYLIEHFSLSTESAQLDLFFFLGASAIGGFIGGPLGDRIGRKAVIWLSILGTLPFSLALPYAGLNATIVLVVIIGLIISSAFSAIVVFAQELVPHRVGMISGLFFGFAFGMGGAGAAVLGSLADRTGIEFVYFVCSFLPLMGLLAVFLPNTKTASDSL